METLLTAEQIKTMLPNWEYQGNASAHKPSEGEKSVMHRGWEIHLDKHHGMILAAHVLNFELDCWFRLPTYISFDCRDRVGILEAAIAAINKIEGST